MADPTFNTLIAPNSGLISFSNDPTGSSNLPSLSSSARIVYTAGGGLTITSKVSSMEKFAVEGRLGTLFTVTDAVSGALFQLRDVTGFPIVEFLDNGDLVTTGSITAVEGNSQEWSSAYTTVKANSASWEESAEILPTVTNYLSTNNVLMLSATIMNSLSVGGTLYTSTTADSILKYSSNVGNGIGTSFNIIHNFNTKDIVVSVYDNNTNIQAYPAVTIMDFDTINLQFSLVPSNNAYKVVVLGTKPSNKIAAFGNVTNTIYALEKYQFKTANFDVISGYYAVDTTSGPVKGKLPAVPNLGDTFSFIDTYQTWNTYNFVLDRNGNTIESLSQDLSANISGFAFKLTWVGGPDGWRVY